jgi:hypothetical protein
VNLECFYVRALLLEGTRLALFPVIYGFIFNFSVTRNTCFCVSLVFTSVRETAQCSLDVNPIMWRLVPAAIVKL